MNEVYKEYFPTDPPARRTVQAKLIEDYKSRLIA
jgi:enamine deaminase RidA (YjgF/YER057c/UK114 family)